MPQKKSKTGLIIGLVVGGIALLCVLPIAVLGYFGANLVNKKVTPVVGCSVGFVEAQQAMIQYADAHGGRLPKAQTWQDDIRPFFEKVDKNSGVPLKSAKVFPANGDWVCTDEKNTRTGIAFNSKLSGAKISEILDPSTTPMLFEVERTGTNLSEPYRFRRQDLAPLVLGEHRTWIVMYVGATRARSEQEINVTEGMPSSPSPTAVTATSKGIIPIDVEFLINFHTKALLMPMRKRDVAEELGLTRDQYNRMRKILNDNANDMVKSEPSEAEAETKWAKASEACLAVLNDDQKQRLQEIAIQRTGPSVILEPFMQKALQLSGDQVEKAVQLRATADKERAALPKNGNAQTFGQKYDEVEKRANDGYLELLSPKQKDLYRQVQGELLHVANR